MSNKQKHGSATPNLKKKSARSKSGGGKEKKETMTEKLKNVKLQLISIETELENERNQRNKLQIERDKLQQFWDTSKDQLKNMRQEFVSRTQKADETNDKLQKDITFLNEKIAFLLRDHERELLQINESEILNPKDPSEEIPVPVIADDIWNKIASDQNNLLLVKESEIEEVKKEYEKIIRFNKEAYENEKQQTITILKKQHDDEIRKFKLGKIQQFDELLARHQKQIKNLQDSYEEEIKSKKAEIASVQNDVGNVNEKYFKLENAYKNSLEKNGQLENQIRILNETVDNFSKDVKKSENLKRDAELYKKQFKQTKSSLQEWKEKYEILYQKSLKVEKERDKLYTNFQQTVNQIQHQASIHKNILNQQIARAEENLNSNRIRRTDVESASVGLEAI